MARDKNKTCWRGIALKERLAIYAYSLLIALWVLIKCALKLLLKSEKTKVETWDRPPSCLVDNALGYHSYVKLQGVKLHYVESGLRHSELVLLLHGFPDCWLGWRNQIKFLSNHYRVVAVDLKGFGDSDKPIWRTRYKMETILSELYELIDSLGSRNCILVGHDLGAHIAWYFASLFPDVVNKFVAISCPHPNVYWDSIPDSSPFNWRWMRFAQAPLLPETMAKKSLYSHLYAHREEKLKHAYDYVFSRSSDWSGPINYYRNLPFYRILPRVRVQVPTMLVVGNKDPFVPLESVVKSTDYADKFVVKMVQSSSHAPHQECASDVNDLLLSFLKGPTPIPAEKTETSRGLIGSLYSNTVKYGNSLVDGVMKTTNGVVRLPSQMLKHSVD